MRREMKSGHRFLSQLQFAVETYEGKEICGDIPCFFQVFVKNFLFFLEK